MSKMCYERHRRAIWIPNHNIFKMADSHIQSAFKKPGLSFFRFPRQKERCDIWVRNLRRKDLDGKSPDDLKFYIVCQEHFEDSQFMNVISR